MYDLLNDFVIFYTFLLQIRKNSYEADKILL